MDSIPFQDENIPNDNIPNENVPNDNISEEHVYVNIYDTLNDSNNVANNNNYENLIGNNNNNIDNNTGNNTDNNSEEGDYDSIPDNDNIGEGEYDSIPNNDNIREGEYDTVENFNGSRVGFVNVEECCICLDIMLFEIALLGCQHEYHLDCISKWINTKSSYVFRCPLCQKHTGIVNVYNKYPDENNNTNLHNNANRYDSARLYNQTRLYNYHNRHILDADTTRRLTANNNRNRRDEDIVRCGCCVIL